MPLAPPELLKVGDPLPAAGAPPLLRGATMPPPSEGPLKLPPPLLPALGAPAPPLLPLGTAI